MTLGPTIAGLALLHRGKVRDTYAVPNRDDLLFVVASDRISVFDFVLNATVPGKGEILTAMNVFWSLLLNEYDHDLVAFGREIDAFLPRELRWDTELQKRGVVVKKLHMIPVEAIVRGYLTGSGLTAYKETSPHVVCGHTLPDGLTDGSMLPTPIFTPTTKAEEGHDEHITAQSVEREYGNSIAQTTLSIYHDACAYALRRGVIIADTKFELGTADDMLICGDERLTPDSSRFWDGEDYERARTEGRTPHPFDKQHVRNYAEVLGIRKKNPLLPSDYAWVREQVFPPEILETTTRLYRTIFERLAETKLESFWEITMGISV